MKKLDNPSDARMLSARRVLVVEDNVDLRIDLRDLLSLEGYHVLTAADGREALACLAQNDVDIVVSDYEMPNMDGIALWKALRLIEKTATLPFILVSTEARPVITSDPGFRFLRKPIAISDLLSAIEQAAAAQRA